MPSDRDDLKPTTRFAGLAATYARHRPSYPLEARDAIVELAHLGPRSLVADIGAGTGISSRFLAAAGVPVVGVEPNAEMRAEAERGGVPKGAADVTYVTGRAEQTGLRDESVDAVLVAQAFHWFDRAQSLREMHRIVKPGGYVFLLGNERDESDAFTAAYGKILRSTPEAVRVEEIRADAGETLLHVPLFEAAEKRVFLSAQALDADGLVGRALSSSYAPRQAGTVAPFLEALDALFAAHAEGGIVHLKYETALFAARRYAR